MKKKIIFFVVLPLLAIAGLYTWRNYTPRAGDSFAFPVSGKKSNVGSVWGDDRDGGRRKHRGIDIFAAKHTPVVAIADGVIMGGDSDRLGGKVIRLRPSGKLWIAYYAHLDTQLVKEGDHVKKGDVIGTVGNTGNARTTPPHLHFGMYTMFGAIDPLPFMRTAPKVLLTAKR